MVFRRIRQARAARRDRDLARDAFDVPHYLACNPDIIASGIDTGATALQHFLEIGWAEGRDPSPDFSVSYYLRQNRDVMQSGVNPLLHYLKAGRAEGRLPLPPVPAPQDRALAETSFDAGWYLQGFATNARPDDPLDHYLRYGWLEGRDPAEWFSTRNYLVRHPGLANGLLCPLVHYLQGGDALIQRPADAVALYRVQAAAVAPGPGYEEADLATGTPRADVIAYYLPQFHTVPENDAFWGEGFTEWRNVARGMPRYQGHVQPRLPRDLGFYTLSGDTYHRQTQLARAAGIAAFCHYYYNFAGKRVLERPIEAMLADPTADFPFLLMWANEDWTRTWDGAEGDVLLRQSYDPTDDAAICDDLARHFADPRYYRLNGRPLFVIYRVGLIPDAAARVAAWRQHWAQKHGVHPLIYMAQTFSDHDPRAFGLDGAFEFPPHKANHFLPDTRETVTLLDTNFQGRMYDYADMVTFSAQEPAPEFPLVRCAFPAWDNECRRPGRGMVFVGSTPAAFQGWMTDLIAHAQSHPVEGRAVVAVNAWNEWAEGAVLEPDLHHGHAYLNALSRAVRG